jgi:hypothetical protein
MLKNLTGMKEILHRQNSRPFLTKFLLLCYQTSLLVIGRALVAKSEMIRTKMGTHNTSEMVAVLETPCAIPPHNSNSINI